MSATHESQLFHTRMIASCNSSSTAPTTVTTGPSTSTSSFRMLQLNTLAHWACDDETPEAYDARTSLHAQHIAALAPSIVVLQEVDTHATAPPNVPRLPDRLLNEQEKDGGISYRGVCGGKGNEKGDETWILWDSARFVLAPEASRLHRLEEGASQFAISVSLLPLAEWEATAGHDNHERTSLTRPIVIVGYHAKAGRTEPNEAMRIRHSRLLWNQLETAYPHAMAEGRLFLLGDFNAGPHSYNGQFPADWYPQVVEGEWGPAAGVTSAYRRAARRSRVTTSSEAADEGSANVEPGVVELSDAPDEEPLITTFKWRKGVLLAQCIDYIFVMSHGATVTAVLEMPRDAAELPEGGLPAVGLWGSDHLSIACDVQLLK